MRLPSFSLLFLFLDIVVSQSSGQNNATISASNATSTHSTNSTQSRISTVTTIQSIPVYLTVTVATTITLTFVDSQCAPKPTSPIPIQVLPAGSAFPTVVTIWTTITQACGTAGTYTIGTTTTYIASPTTVTYIGLCPTTVVANAQSSAGGAQIIVGKATSGVATVYTISSGTVIGQSVQTVTSSPQGQGQSLPNGPSQSNPISSPKAHSSSNIVSSSPIWLNSSTASTALSAAGSSSSTLSYISSQTSSSAGLSLSSSSIPASPGSSSTSSPTSTSAASSLSTSSQGSTSVGGIVGGVAIISPTSCPASTPTGRFLGTVAPSVSMYAPIPFTDPPYQLQGTEDDGTPIIFDIDSPDTITASYENGTSFSISSDGTFSFIVAGCQYEFTGKASLPPTTKKRNSRSLRKRSFLKSTVTVDITLYNQCGNPSTGQEPHLLCAYVGQESNDYSPTTDFLESGDGLYTGECPVPLIGTLKCDLAETACETGTFIGSQAYGFGNTLLCNGIATGVIAAAAAATEGLSFLASTVTFTIVSGICSNTLGWLEGKVCAVEFPPTATSSACPQPTVVPTLSISNWLDLLGHTTSIIGDVTVASSTLVSTTVTAYVPSCTATGNPLPTIPELSCPGGQNRLRGAVKLCESCYLSGLPGTQGDSPVDVCCDTCCGCCAPCGSVINSNDPYPPDTSKLCCSPSYVFPLTICGSDACQTETCALCTPQSVLSTGLCNSNCYDPNLYSFWSPTDGLRTIYPGGQLL